MNVVIPVRKGGLGNQMFQIAAALVYAKEKNKTVVIPLETPHIHRVHQEPYEKSIFQEIPSLNTALDASSIYALCQNGFTLYPEEPTFEKWEPLSIPGNVILHGYFQYYPSLEPHRKFLASFYLKNLQSYLVPGKREYVGIHIRRGDYLQFQDVFCLLDLSYYFRAIREIQRLTPGKKVFKVFSDDIAWCKEQDVFQSLESVEFIEEKDEIKCLCQMIACEGGFICANSSYSWWAAFLGAFQTGAPCIVPETWCKDFTGDLLPEQWIQIPTAKGCVQFYEPGTLNLHKKIESENILKPSNETVELYSDSLAYTNSSNPKVFLQLEPLVIKNTEEHLLKNYSLYDKIFTFHQTTLEKCPNAVKLMLPACTWISGTTYHNIDTTKKQFAISCITGFKQLAEGHTYRLLLYFNQKILVDTLQLPITFYRSSAGEHLPEITKNPFIYEDKFPLFETFQYSLVIENSAQKNYFTEKLIDCLITKTIPIYYGCPNISEYFDTTGWILLTHPDPEERIRELVHKWREANFTTQSYNQFSETIETNYRICKEKYSGFYTKINASLLELPFF